MFARVSLPQWFAMLLLATALGGCVKVNFAAGYDQTLDNLTTTLQQDTFAFFAHMADAGDLQRSYAANAHFYAAARGKTAALISRAAILEDGLEETPLSDNFIALQQQYADLAAAHKRGSPPAFFKAAESAFDQSFRAITRHLLALK